MVAIAAGFVPTVEATELLDLNTATIKQLGDLPSLGAERAEMIVRMRDKSGPFRAMEELLSMPRLSRRELDELKKLLFVSDESRTRKTADSKKRANP